LTRSTLAVSPSVNRYQAATTASGHYSGSTSELRAVFGVLSTLEDELRAFAGARTFAADASEWVEAALPAQLEVWPAWDDE
jgi:hypothetical protein